MSIIIQIIVSILILSFPIIFIRIYWNTIEKNSNQIVESFMTDSSEKHKDLKVWVKNFDITKKKNKFDFNLFQTTYYFNDCDLILNPDSFIIIGKTKSFGKIRNLTPIVFISGEKSIESKNKIRIVKYENIRDNGTDLEIDFVDSYYSNIMTFVLKRIDNELKSKIKKRATTKNIRHLANSTKNEYISIK